MIKEAVANPSHHGRGTVDADHPWPGLESFREEDREYFHGRETETEDLARLVMRERLAVVFGKSGLGKTSLLRAGLFPRLREQDVLPVYLRLNFADGSADFRAQVMAAIAVAAAAANVEAPAPASSDTLWEYFHRQGTDFWSPRNRPLVPLLAFDQFEEIFTLGRATPERAARTDALVAELADLAEGRPSDAVKARLDASPEEGRAFSFGRHPYKILLSLREDFLADLEALRDRIRPIVFNRLRLRGMRGENALEVVTLAGDVITRDVALRVVRFVAAAEEEDASTPLDDLRVEPALLSVVCRELNQRRLERGEPRITSDLVVGSQAEILSGFYEEGVAGVGPEVRSFIEDRLLTVTGFRDSVAVENALEMPGITEDVLARLVDRRLLRIEDHGGVSRLELTHDLLTEVIGASRDRRHQREAQERAEAERREAEERERKARLELRRSRRFMALLALLLIAAIVGAAWGFIGQQRAVAEQKRAQAEEQRADKERDAALLAREQAVKAQEQERIQRQVALAAKIEADKEAAAAEKERAVAEQRRREAVAARNEEEKQRVEADKQRQNAEAATLKAVAASTAAEKDRRKAVVAQEAEIKQREKAEDLRMLSVAGELAAESARMRQENQAELAVLLALTAYRFELDHGGDVDSPGIYDALRRTLSRLRPDLATAYEHRAPVRAMALGPGGRRLFTATDDGQILARTIGGGEPDSLGDLEASARAVALSPAGDRLAAGDSRGSIRLWELGDAGRKSRVLPAPETGEARINALAFVSGGRLAAGIRLRRDGVSAGEVRMWNLNHRPTAESRGGSAGVAPSETLPIGQASVSALAAGAGALAAGTPGGALLWDLGTSPPGEPTILCHEGDPRISAVSLGGGRLACGKESGTIEVWDPATGKKLHQLEGGHGSRVTSLSFGPEGEGGHLLGSASLDGSVRLWDLNRLDRPPIVIPDHGNWVWSVLFSPAGDRLLSAGADLKVRVWPTQTGPLVSAICGSVSRFLSPQEWAQYLPAGIEYETYQDTTRKICLTGS